MRWLVCLALAACGDNAASECSTAFDGSFTDRVRAASACPTLDAGELAFAVDSHVLGAQAIASFTLGDAVTAGRYSSQTVTSWHFVEARSVGDGACVYSAGDEVTPHGSFTLVLDGVDPAHGTLEVTQYVHAVDGTDCGPADLEYIRADF